MYKLKSMKRMGTTYEGVMTNIIEFYKFHTTYTCNINCAQYTKNSICRNTNLSAILIIRLSGCEYICKFNCTVLLKMNERQCLSKDFSCLT